MKKIKKYFKDKEITVMTVELLDSICEEKRYRDAEIQIGIDGQKKHAKTVLSWVEKLADNPSTALKISALFHDIDTIVTKNAGGGFKGDRKSKEYQDHKKAHAKRSADYICSQLLKKDVKPKLIERIRFLITHHDDIGIEVQNFNDHELDILVAADSFAFFSSIAPKLYKLEGEKRLKDKIRFMIEKMPVFAKALLASHRVKNDLFNRLKNKVLKEQE